MLEAERLQINRFKPALTTGTKPDHAVIRRTRSELEKGGWVMFMPSPEIYNIKN